MNKKRFLLSREVSSFVVSRMTFSQVIQASTIWAFRTIEDIQLISSSGLWFGDSISIVFKGRDRSADDRGVVQAFSPRGI